MKKKFLLLFASIFFAITYSYGQTFPTSYLLYNGSPTTKVNIVILPDGYTTSQLSKFVTDAQNVVNVFFSRAPFNTLKSRFNVVIVKVPSNVSGAGSSPSYPIDNYFGSCFYTGGIQRLLAPTKTSKVASVLRSNFPSYDIVCVQVNTTTYGGSGGTYATYSMHSQAPDLAIHEIGHSYGVLADEYYAGAYYLGEKANQTKNSNPATIKWKAFLNQGGVGIYPFAENPAWFRPHQSCEMRYLGYPFCLVCQNQITQVTISQSAAYATAKNLKTNSQVNAAPMELCNFIRISPNPAVDYFNLELNAFKNDEQVTVYIYDIQGRLIMKKQVCGARTDEISTTQLKGNGNVFLVKAVGATNSYTQKLILAE
ncbi:MAG: T9SS C-terminal target domain-containing protein [Bacteroidales bacterium]|nr:MAG: T9SS C-terminal target domain-containing protein [Bacteroidales bacterium]